MGITIPRPPPMGGEVIITATRILLIFKVNIGRDGDEPAVSTSGESIYGIVYRRHRGRWSAPERVWT